MTEELPFECHNLKINLNRNPFDLPSWIRLSKIYTNRFKKSRDMMDLKRAEISYVGALYNDLNDPDLAREWLGVFALLHAVDMPKEEIMQSARVIEMGLREVAKSPERLNSELRALVGYLDKTHMTFSPI